MPSIGAVWWTAEIRQAEAAAEKADNLQRELDQTAEKARDSNAALNRAGDSAGEAGGRMGRLRNSAGRLSGTLGLLTSGLFFLATTLSNVAGISLTLGGAWATASAAGATLWGWLVAIGGYLSGALTAGLSTAAGYVSSFVGWLAAGSAGALAVAGAIGVAIGVLGVFILEMTGVLDAARNFGQYVGGQMSPAIRDAFISLIGFVAGPLAVVGAAITGFVQGYLRGGLSEGIDQAVASAQEALGIFEGAWDRTLARVLGWAQDFSGDIASAIGGSVRTGFNAVVPNSVDIPTVTIAGRSIGGGSINLPQLQTGGLIERAGAAFLHPGEAVVPADVTRNVQSGGSGAGGGGGGGVTIESVTVEIGDQTLDLSTLSRTGMQELADLIGDEFGGEIESLVS